MIEERKALLEEIERLKVVRSLMVGTLYPNIIADQINKLLDRIEELDNPKST